MYAINIIPIFEIEYKKYAFLATTKYRYIKKGCLSTPNYTEKSIYSSIYYTNQVENKIYAYPLNYCAVDQVINLVWPYCNKMTFITFNLFQSCTENFSISKILI